MPGILRTPAYALSLFRDLRPMLDEATVEKRLADRISRQALLDKWPAPTISFVLAAAVLLRPFGGPEVHREQLRRILDVAGRRTVDFQIMPLDGHEHPYLGGAFTLLTPKGRRETAYTEIYGHPRLITDPEEVRQYTERYGVIRSQALTQHESLTWLEKPTKAASASKLPPTPPPSTSATPKSPTAPSSPSLPRRGRPSSRTLRRNRKDR
ncbi:DUF5753 domain-containing protein [Streptomyces narbonensis]|uniref:DUF5753 domain-containing protein n=1 Tax=Streptomyces narbonensis TaxID=67333 RepID=UPI003F4D3D5D